MTDEILFKYISDQADDKEKQAVRQWASVSEKRQQELFRMKNSWILSGLESEIDPVKKEKAIQLIMDKISAINKKENFKKRWVKRFKYAAVILLIVGVSGVSGYFISNFTSSNSGFTEIIVPKGERSKVVLPDGSKVQLNGGTQLKFESTFQTGKRKVFLNGEAFFEVTHDKFHPFVVETNNMFHVEVLGTTFNVSAYSDDKAITTYLETGKVKISIDGEDNIILTPKEVLRFEKAGGKITKQTINDHRFSDWTKGILNIKGETIEELAKKLERRFDIQIIFGDDDVRAHTYSGSIKDENLNTILEALKFTSALNYERNNKAVIIYSRK